MEAYQREMSANKTSFIDTTETELKGIVLGYFKGQNKFFELGFCHALTTSKFIFVGLGTSAEVNFKDKVNGYKFSLWVNSLISLGLNTILYHNYNKISEDNNKVGFAFRPDIGFGYSVFNVTYSYNFMLVNSKLAGINKHMLSLRCVIPVFKKK